MLELTCTEDRLSLIWNYHYLQLKMFFFISPTFLRFAFVAKMLPFFLEVKKVNQLFTSSACQSCCFLATLRPSVLPFIWTRETKLIPIFISAEWIYMLWIAFLSLGIGSKGFPEAMGSCRWDNTHFLTCMEIFIFHSEGFCSEFLCDNLHNI